MIRYVNKEHIEGLKSFKGAKLFESGKYLKLKLGQKEFRARK